MWLSPAVARHADESTHYTFSVTWQYCQFKEVLTCSWVGRHVASWGNGRTLSRDKSSCIKGKQSTDRLYIAFRVETNVQVMNGANITILLLYCYCWPIFSALHIHLNARKSCQHQHRVLLSAYKWTSTYWPAGRPVLQICSLQLLFDHQTAIFAHSLSGPLSSFKCHII